MPKRGKLSGDERNFMLAQAGKMTPQQIADKLDRRVETVEEFIRENVKPTVAASAVVQAATVTEMEAEAERFEIRKDLRESEAWKNLQSELEKEEIKFFEERFIKMMTQFKDQGVLATEEAQIFQVIKIEVLQHRNMVERKKAREDIARLEVMQREMVSKFQGNLGKMSKEEQADAIAIEHQLDIARSSEQSRTTEWTKLQDAHDGLMKSLKATRDARVKQIESGKVNFLGIVKMLEQKDIQEREGRKLGLVKMAAHNEYNKLGRPTKYEDGMVDNPILSAETVDFGPEEEDERGSGGDGQTEGME